MSGILGLAYDTISVDHLPTWLSSSTLEDKSFSFNLQNNPEESYMVIPGYESDKFDIIKKHSVIEQKYWALEMDFVQQGN
jgi:hypothetical protein